MDSGALAAADLTTGASAILATVTSSATALFDGIDGDFLSGSSQLDSSLRSSANPRSSLEVKHPGTSRTLLHKRPHAYSALPPPPSSSTVIIASAMPLL
eukprot:CAMPEP_0185841726 /NCGR_PEP_ID=MMETSP1353-20130828/18044_1 /TAXON_ID=1077150 /ORGANISM="Erythrolobus australicus, Strain CCMP3124" /LENGTH=98 /DNA_ID=CAMNT_0028541213 /DNA_START=1223 /DNA_END=1517 /DNA_ORIENTATION=+